MINEAYAILSDGDRRAQYDRYGRVDLPPGGVDLGGIEDLFGDLFEGFFGGGRGGRRGRARSGDDLRYDLEITLEEAAQGLETRLQIPRLEACETCRGSGAEPGSGRTPVPDLQGARPAALPAGLPHGGPDVRPVRRRGPDRQEPVQGLLGRGPGRAGADAQGAHPARRRRGRADAHHRRGGRGRGRRPGRAISTSSSTSASTPSSRARATSSTARCRSPSPRPRSAPRWTCRSWTASRSSRCRPAARTATCSGCAGRGCPASTARGRGDACYSVVVEVPRKLTGRAARAPRGVPARVLRRGAGPPRRRLPRVAQEALRRLSRHHPVSLRTSGASFPAATVLRPRLPAGGCSTS